MGSAIGDILKSKRIEEQDRPGLIHRLLDSGLRGAAWLPDALGNNVPKGVNYLADALLNRFTGPDNQDVLEKAYQRNLDIGAAPNDSVEGALKKIGLIQDLPQADTFGEKAADLTGSVVGSLAGGGALEKGALNLAGKASPSIAKILLGTDSPVSAAILNPTAARTAGSVALPLAAEPINQSLAPDSPKTLMAMRLAEALAGGKFGGMALKAALPGVAASIPARTAAQQSALDNGITAPRTQDLIAKQLDIAKKDPQAADALNSIASNQQANILNNLTPKNPISGGSVINQIKSTLNQMKAQKNADYQTSLNTMLEGAPAEGINVKNTIAYLTDEFNKAARGSPLQSAIGKALNLVTDNASDAQQIISAKTAIQALAKPNSGLALGSKESAILNGAAKQLNSDIDMALPGYADMNAQYAQQSNQLTNLINGTIGNAVKSGTNKPSTVIQNLFEKTDPELAGQLRQALPEGVYNQAADMYLGSVKDRGLLAPTKNSINNIGKLQKIASILQSKRDTLSQTLPDYHNGIVDQTLQGINESGLGMPRNDYTIGARRNVAVGGEIRGLGSMLQDAAMYLPRKAGLDYLNRQEMLTGTSPTQQVIQGAQNMAPGLIRNTAMAGAITDGQQPPPQSSIPPQAPAMPQIQPSASPVAPMIPPQPQGQPQNAQISPLDAVMSKYGIGGQQQGQQPAAAGISPPVAAQIAPKAPASPLDSVMSKYGIGQAAAQAQQGQQALPQSAKPIPYSPDELQYLDDRIKAGDMDAISNFDTSFKSYKQSKQQQLLPQGTTNIRSANDGSSIMMQVKDAAQRAFPNNPTMQKVAMAQAILESGLNGHPSHLATDDHNLFGIKEGHTAPGNAQPVAYNTTEYAGGNPGTENAQFSANNSYDDSLNQYKNLMTRSPRYADVVNAQDPSMAFAALQSAHYATDPNYAAKLNSIYNRNVMPLFAET